MNQRRSMRKRSWDKSKKRDELQNLIQENEELRCREATSQKKVDELSKLLEEAISKKQTEENGELTDSENYVNKKVLVVAEQAVVEEEEQKHKNNNGFFFSACYVDRSKRMVFWSFHIYLTAI